MILLPSKQTCDEMAKARSTFSPEFKLEGSACNLSMKIVMGILLATVMVVSPIRLKCAMELRKMVTDLFVGV